MTDTEQLREILALSAKDGLEMVADVTLQKSDTDIGFSGEPLWDRIAHAPEGDLVDSGLPVEVRRWDRQAGVFNIVLSDGDRVHELRGASQSFAPNSWWVDARGGPVRIHIELASGDEIALLLEAERVAVARAQRHFTCPSLPELGADEWVAPWLHDLFEQSLASPVPLDRVAAVGYVLRHAQLGSVGSTAADLVNQGRRRRAAAERWFLSLGPGIRNELLGQALVQAEHLRTALFELDQAEAIAEGELDAVMEYLCLERERLECIREVFRDSSSPALAHSLERVDFEAEPHLARVFSAAVDSKLLHAVAELQPEAWWGRA